MLVLSRKVGEKIIIGSTNGEIVLQIAEIRGGRVRLALDAPRSCRIMRAEIADSPDTSPRSQLTEGVRERDASIPDRSALLSG